MSRIHLPTFACVLLGGFALLGASACSSDNSSPKAPSRDCITRVVAKPRTAGASMGLKGSWDGWNGVSVTMHPRSDGMYEAALQLPPGEYGYVIVEDGSERFDTSRPLTAFHAGQEVSWFEVPDCTMPELRIDDVVTAPGGRVQVTATFLTASSREPLAVDSIRVSGGDGVSMRVETADPVTGKVVVGGAGASRGRHSVVIEASDRQGRPAAAGRAVAWVEPAAAKWEDGILYQVMIDRFLGDAGKHLGAPPTPGSRAGGTLDGVRSAIESGQLEYLGVSGIWLSPVYVNPVEARQGQWDGNLYEGYHGYWPVQSRQVDDRLGGADALKRLVDAAHQRGMRVLLDIVPNHVYESNPIYAEKSAEGWFYDGADKCVCGSGPCPWSTHIETCWFTSYLPDYRWTHIDVMRHGQEESLWWVREFNLDGVRVDAVPMMPRAALRRIAYGLRNWQAPRSETFLLGEVYTGGGEGGINEIRYFLGPDGLDSAFDFPLMWSMRETIAKGTGGFQHIAQTLEMSARAFEGSGVVMGRIVGNHDTTRFLSEAHGDAGGDAWHKPAEQPSTEEPYRRHWLAMALVLTQPGLPVIYYGDEIGLAGGGDPDCRRVMPQVSTINDHQHRLLLNVGMLGRLRRCSPALRHGTTTTLQADQDTYAFVRDAGDGFPVVVLMSKAPRQRTVQLTGLQSAVMLDVVSGERLSVGASNTGVLVEPLTVRVLVRGDDPCSPRHL